MKWLRLLLIEINEISKKLIYPVILVAIIMFILAFSVYVLECIPISLPAKHKYDVLKDVLQIVLVIVGVIGLGIFWGLHKMLKDDVEKIIEEKFSDVRGEIEILNGFTLWTIKNIDGAISNTKRALGRSLKERDEIMAKNNIAYYYAEKHEKEPPQWGLKDEAIKFAEYVYKKYDKYREGYNDPNWIETYAFVKSRFAKEDREREETMRELKELIRREDLKEIKEDLEKSVNYLIKNDPQEV